MRRAPSRTRLFVLAALLAAGPGAAAEQSSDPGRAMYLRYCGACHGPAGKGDGVAGSFMSPKPADLTKLAQKNGGTFPFQKVLAYVDGREDVRAHGDPAMPVWGETFHAEAAWGQRRRAEVQGKLMLITHYARSTQAK
jgi:mono/diheme cytochrome c family protein